MITVLVEDKMAQNSVNEPTSSIFILLSAFGDSSRFAFEPISLLKLMLLEYPVFFEDNINGSDLILYDPKDTILSD